MTSRARVDLEAFARRLIQDAFQQGSVAYWRRRAAQFRAVGTPSCADTALACERHAWLIEAGVVVVVTRGEIDDALDEAELGTAPTAGRWSA